MQPAPDLSNSPTGEPRQAAAASAYATFDVKGVMMSITVLRLRSKDMNLVERQLHNKVTQFPQFFENAPVVLDFEPLSGSAEGLRLTAFVRALRARKVVPVGVMNLEGAHHDDALAAGLGVMRPVVGARAQAVTPEARSPVLEPEPAATTTPAAPPPRDAARPQVVYAHRPPLVLHQAVRSGQEVHARQSDLIVLGPVNPGAEISADGNIHVYGVLRGRAIAGARGYTQARIFCQRMDAELVCVAGAYMLAEDIPETLREKPAQVFLENGECEICAL
jgi:septum site-determining protein MinC